jgi:chemotaxis protein methyltransferase CheR
MPGAPAPVACDPSSGCAEGTLRMMESSQIERRVVATTPGGPARQRAPIPALDAGVRAKYLHLIEARFGLRLSVQQALLLEEVVGRLLEPFGGTADRMYEALAAGRQDDLWEALADGLTIRETHFFRVTPQIEAIRRHVLPALLRRRQDVPAERRLSIWSAGCSTGEEAYTLAILLREQWPSMESWRIDILGTDLSPAALTRAAEARYGDWSFRDTPPAIRQRYFIPEGKRWRLADPVRRLVRFARHNLVSDPFPTTAGGFDLILCRNVTIYFSPQTTQRLYHRFAAALAPGGWLILGPSDSPPAAAAALEACYLNGAILWRRRADGPAFDPASPAPPATPAAATPATRRTGDLWPATRPGQPSPRSTPIPRPIEAEAPGRPGGRPGDPAPAGVAQLWPLVRGGDRVAAGELATRLATTAPLEAEVHLVRGLVLLDEGDPERALEVLRRAVFLAPNNALAQVSLGRACHRLGSRERARAALSRARRILAPLPGADLVPGGGGVTAGELRRSIDALFAEHAQGAG